MVLLGAAVTLGFLGMFGSPAKARPAHGTIPSASGPVFAWILLDAETGQVLSEQNADVLTYPASLSKMMTLYLVFEALNQGRLRLDQLFTVSTEAASRSPSKLGLTPGTALPLRDLILAVVTRSANDAAAVIAENLAGSEPNFANHMTAKARQLGMQHTWFQNASGLPNPDQRTTARDMARLSLALYHQFPREYRYFSTRAFDFRGDTVRSHNRLLSSYQGADGIKTGFINASGFNLAASAVRDGRRLIGVIMGGRSARTRDAQMASLLDQGFALLASGNSAPLRGTIMIAEVPPTPAATTPSAASGRARVPATIPTRRGPALRPAALPSADSMMPAGNQQKLRSIGTVASTTLHRLSPVSTAQAAPTVIEAPAPAAAWAIQLGAFRAEASAKRATRQVAGLAIGKGKPQQVLAPAKSDKTPLYRARLLKFTQKDAQAACAELKRRGLACAVVRPGR